jgi:hypothetical protein
MSPGQEGQPKRKRIYFQPGEVLLLVEHDNTQELSPAAIATKIRDMMIGIEDHLQNVYTDPCRVFTFVHGDSAFQLTPARRPEKKAFSLVTLDVSADVHNSNQLLELIQKLNQNFLDNRDQLLKRELTPHTAAPNWLTVPTPPPILPQGNNADGGGPGARPTPYSGDLVHPPYRFLLPQLAEAFEASQTQEVDVAILDTAPSVCALESAYARFNHVLLERLVGPTGVPGPQARLEITYANGEDIILPRPEDLRVKDHDYIMNDHGLFIAGIIASIEETAHLHLIQVLNQVGVGTAESIAQGFTVLRRWRRGRNRPLVVNCSLMLVEPMPGHEWPKADDEGDDELEQSAPQSLRPLPPELLVAAEQGDESAKRERDEIGAARQKLAISIEWICLSAFDSGIAIVAAAGNDAIDGKGPHGTHRPQARFPAAFDKVVGVGALKKDDMQAEYSNISDQPGAVGITTLGGRAEMRAIPSQPHKQVAYAVENESVLGVYIGDFPGLDPGTILANTNGWGWWAGTSFAAPVVSGAIAALVARGYWPHDASLLVQAKTSGTTPDSEPRLLVDQVA